MVKFQNGMTVRDLKDAIANWPEVDNWGCDTEVWIETTPNTSTQVGKIMPLNVCGGSSDILLCVE